MESNTREKKTRKVQPGIGVNNEEARLERYQFLVEQGKELSSFEESVIKASAVRGNIESFLGTCSIPVGLVGPLKVETEEGQLEDVFTVAATTEGALVASMNRGASIISRCGGVHTHVQSQTMLRAPMFIFENLAQAREFSKWIVDQKEYLSQYIKKYSNHAKLVKIVPNLMGRNVDCKFYYQTGDAAGQNMTTTCTWQACLWIEGQFNKTSPFPIKDFVLECNGAADKKVAHHTIQNGRGVHVIAECVIDREVLEKKLKVTPEAVLHWFNISYQLTSYDGMIGNNINIANALAAIFTATGQDIACIHESAIGFLQVEAHPRGLYFSLKLPKLVIGTVGGGTGLASQRDALELMDCYGPGKVNRFARILAGFTLALEISTFSAMVSGQFAVAHERLGRNKPVDFLSFKDLKPDFFKQNLNLYPYTDIQFVNELSESNGIITQLTDQQSKKYLGLSLWSLVDAGKRKMALLKSKPNDLETLNCMYKMTGLIDPRLAKKFSQIQDQSEFNHSHKKELDIYEYLADKRYSNIPKVYGVYSNQQREANLLLLEFLRQDDYRIINSELEPGLWTQKDLELTLTAVNQAHFSLNGFKNDYLNFQKVTRYKEFTLGALETLKAEYGKKYHMVYEMMDSCLRFVMEHEDSIINLAPPVIVHNDFNPRNIAISNNNRVKIYDWELATYDVATRDMMELMSFVYGSGQINSNMTEIIEYFRNISQSKLDSETYLKVSQYGLAKFVITRLQLYMLGNKLSRYDFLPIVIENSLNIYRELKI